MRCPLCQRLQNAARKCEACGGPLPEVSRRRATGRRRSGTAWVAIALIGVVTTLAIVSNAQEDDDYSTYADSYASSDSTGGFATSSSSDTADGYLASVRSGANFPDDDSTLLAVGEGVCDEIESLGYARMRSNFSQSSFTSSQQSVIISAAERHLC